MSQGWHEDFEDETYPPEMGRSRERAMRATTLAHPMTSSEKSRTLPTPKFQVGDRVTLDTSSMHYESNRRYYGKCYLQYLIRKWRGKSRGRLSEGAKKIIRECMEVLSNATEGEIAGIRCKGMHGVDIASYNECYVGGVPGASSPLYFDYQVLIRFQRDGNRMAMTTGQAIIGESNLVKVD